MNVLADSGARSAFFARIKNILLQPNVKGVLAKSESGFAIASEIIRCSHWSFDPRYLRVDVRFQASIVS